MSTGWAYPSQVTLTENSAEASYRQNQKSHKVCQQHYQEAYLNCDPNNSPELQQGNLSIDQIVQSIVGNLGAQKICGQMSDIFKVAQGSMDLYGVSCNELRKSCEQSCSTQSQNLKPILTGYQKICGPDSSRMRVSVDRILRGLGDISQKPYVEAEFNAILSQIPTKNAVIRLPGSGGFQLWRAGSNSFVLQQEEVNNRLVFSSGEFNLALTSPAAALSLNKKLRSFDQFVDGCSREYPQIHRAQQEHRDIARQCQGFEKEVRQAAKTMNQYMGQQATAGQCQKQLSVARSEGCAVNPDSPLCYSASPVAYAGDSDDCPNCKRVAGDESVRTRAVASTRKKRSLENKSTHHAAPSVELATSIDDSSLPAAESQEALRSYSGHGIRLPQEGSQKIEKKQDNETANSDERKSGFKLKRSGKYRLNRFGRKSAKKLKDYLPGGSKDPEKKKSPISEATGPSNFDKISGKYRDKIDTLIPEKVNE